MHSLRPLSYFAEINPSTNVNGVHPESEVVFLPMPAIAEGGGWSSLERRPIKLRHSGYTLFQEGDVLVAKITPCFENGKAAFLNKLSPSIGIGSTEYHVLRAKRGVDPRFIYHWVRHPRFKREGEASMTGSAGQRRVPSQLFDRFLVPDMTSVEQSAVADALDHIDHRVEALVRETDKLQLIRLGLQDDLLQRKIEVTINSKAAE